MKRLLEAGIVAEENVEWTPARIAAFHGHKELLPILLHNKLVGQEEIAEDTKSSEPEGYQHRAILCDGCNLVCSDPEYACTSMIS